jgi:hypothetical protein
MKKLFALFLTLIAFAAPIHSQAGNSITYFYVASSIDSSGRESAFSNEASALVPPGKTVTLTWTNATTLTTTNIYRGTTSGGPYVRIATVAVNTQTFIDLPPAPPTTLSAR